MQKIETLFMKKREGRATDIVTIGAEWVIDGEGVATRKFDGISCLWRDGQLYKRGTSAVAEGMPEERGRGHDFDTRIAAVQAIDGWTPIGIGIEDYWFRDALNIGKAMDFMAYAAGQNPWLMPFANGTYEFCGPKVNGNPEKLARHYLIPHGSCVLLDCPRDFDGLRDYLSATDIEGIVWHHEDGRMIKIKGKNFGIKRR